MDLPRDTDFKRPAASATAAASSTKEGEPVAAPPIHAHFIAGPRGRWRIASISAIAGDTLPAAPALDHLIVSGPADPAPAHAVWSLRGATSNLRYTNASEQTALSRQLAALDRPEATRAALIPIRKSPAWWALAQDRRRALVEEQSRHITIGLEYLPAVARRLYHSRELAQPFDFLTWFEFAPAHEAAFNELVARLRASAEWEYVDREVDIRLERD
jgi:hypothetical protein